jgi:hypothetical protein
LVDISLFLQRLIKIEINLFFNRLRMADNYFILHGVAVAWLDDENIFPERCWQWNRICTIRHFAFTFAPAALAASALAVADFATTTLDAATTFATSTLAVALALALLTLTFALALTSALLARFEKTPTPADRCRARS